MENKENRIIFDWLTFTSKVDTLESIFDLLGLKSDDFIECEKGWNGYKKRLTYENISICYDGSKFFDKSGVMHDMGICVNMSGKGCRAFESLSNIDFFGLFKSISNSDNYNITRLDVAFDDFDNVLDIEMLEKDTRNRNFVSKFKKGKIETSWDCEDYGVCIYFGTRSSELMFRIYDKLAEQKIVNSDEHWVRFEMMLKNDRASFFVENLMNGINISDFLMYLTIISVLLCLMKTIVINLVGKILNIGISFWNITVYSHYIKLLVLILMKILCLHTLIHIVVNFIPFALCLELNFYFII